METKQLKRLPVGIQTFDKLIQGGYLYIDKTAYIHKMVSESNYIFLSRPRRFGKSLLVSTLQSYFEGKKELFKGLAIEQLEKEWAQHPVLRFSLASGKHMEKEQLERYLLDILSDNEERFGLHSDKVDTNIRLKDLIKNVYDKTGKQVVVLIDEYDAPLLDVVHENEQLPILRQVMRNFYSPLKDCDPYLRFVFLTGITKFSQLSIFSELNNLKNISMLPEFAAICGITVEEMQTQMADYIDVFAKTEETGHEEMVEKLKKQYDGYHFTWPSPDIFNPFSLLNAMQDRRLDSYWFASGTPTYLIEMLRKFDVLPSEIKNIEAEAFDFDAPTENMQSITPLLYQSGYITIKDYNKNFNYYTLSIPNKEVRIGLLRSLVPSYVQTSTLVVNNTARKMAQLIVNDDVDSALSLLQKFLQTVPYCDNASSEGHYQQVMFIVFSLLSNYIADVEVRTPSGRVDMVMRTNKALYLFELKMNKSAAAAMKQIDLKDYPARFAMCGLPIVKVGINFDDERRTISDWQIVPTR
ncbi:ATP-binding protein [Prevotella sp. P3-122]|uniref:ATP-binding protein n=1 Tax=Prevotella sp. P3-122 TaxID=2024223 RepID=UPI000B966F42|nr:ATP-binding protein [Prevotella sp. P3-122]OYP58781.1 AAA family ATPase [Prevotella sp. P3-122]